MLQEEDESRDEEFRSDGTDEGRVDDGLTDMLESTRNGLEDTDGVVTLAVGFEGAHVKECRQS